MKTIQSILKRKKISAGNFGKKDLDEKTIGRVFLEAAKKEVKNLENSDIRNSRLKDKNIYIKTAHPVISSELMLKREKILKRVNDIAGKIAIERIVVG
jgi:hypothetical protein